MDEKAIAKICRNILTLAALLHIIYAVIFYKLGTVSGSVYNLVSIVVYIAVRGLVARGKLGFVVAIAHLGSQPVCFAFSPLAGHGLRVPAASHLHGVACIRLPLSALVHAIYLPALPKWRFLSG